MKAHPDFHIISWTDTEIKVKVPSRGYSVATSGGIVDELGKSAGTGKIKIRNSDEEEV